MKIKVIGKAHNEGVAKKTGKPYNFNTVHYIGKQRFVEGECGQQVTLDPAMYPIEDICIGAEYSVEFDNHGFCVDFSRVK